MIYFKKLFKFPSPKELGMSDNDYAMPSRMFPNSPDEVTWEDYYEYLAKTYPVKYFFAATFPQLFRDCWRRFTRPFKDVYYWVVSHTIRQYHWVDLRQPKGYRYGWCDTDHRMVYALMNLFTNFVEQELPYSYFVPSEEEAAKDDGIDYNYAGFKRQLETYKEIIAIYNWITKERLQEDAEEDLALTIWSDARHIWADNEKVLWKELQALENRNKIKLEEILVRILKIRHVLWT